MSMPDVVGLRLGEARQILEDLGILVENVTVTAPPREKTDKYDESYRVVKARRIDDRKIDLLVCKPL